MSISVFTTCLRSFGLPLAQKRVLDGRTERQALDPLRRPIGGNLAAAHPPHFLGVGLEKNAEQALAKLVGDPVLKGLGLRVGWRRAARTRACRASTRSIRVSTAPRMASKDRCRTGRGSKCATTGDGRACLRPQSRSKTLPLRGIWRRSGAHRYRSGSPYS